MSTKDITLEWDSGTAYDFFASLHVLHEPDKYGLRGSWAAGVRSRLPAAERELLQQAMDGMWPYHWVYQLPRPKDATVALEVLEDMAPAECFATLSMTPHMTEPMRDVLRDVMARKSWNAQDVEKLKACYEEEGHKGKITAQHDKKLRQHLDLWTDAAASGEGLLAALYAYYSEFFAEEERRIRPALEAGLERAQALAAELPLLALLDELSQGIQFEEDKLQMAELVLVPSYWATPLVLFSHIHSRKELFLYGARPSNASLVPGDQVPDVLYQTLRALADPTRLRILRYLSDEPLTPAELSRRLRLRAPTVIHHLQALRLARLVHLTLGHDEGKRYAARPEALRSTWAILNDFLDSDDE
jgi:DNA-binding transcriptional ArsR family regulator